MLLQVVVALVGRQLRLEGLVFLDLPLQVGRVLWAKGGQTHAQERETEERSQQTNEYFVGLICGRLHLLIDPALQLVRVSEELLQT